MITDAPQISVVIPAYNAEPWIGETLQSFAQQTFRDFEVIVVDDGSSDGTVEVAESFRELVRLKVIRGKRSGAPARPCNVGVTEAQGRLILPCDSDDLAAPDRLRKMNEAWQTIDEQDCLIFSDYSEIDGEGNAVTASKLSSYARLNPTSLKKLAEDTYFLPAVTAFDALVMGCFIRPCSVAIPKRVIVQVGGYDEKLRNGQDYDLFLRIAHQNPFVWANRILGSYRLTPGNISSRSAIDLVPSRVAVLNRVLKLSLTRTQIATVRDWLAKNYEALGYEYGNRREIRRSLEAYCQAFRQHASLPQLKGMLVSLAKGVIRSSPRGLNKPFQRP